MVRHILVDNPQSRYKKSIKGKIANHRYLHSDKYKLVKKKYIKSKKGGIVREREKALYNPINSLKIRYGFVMENCAICDSNKNIQFHHPNKELPLHVYFVCISCHYDIHHKTPYLAGGENIYDMDIS
jgi:hypothetical protein